MRYRAVGLQQWWWWWKQHGASGGREPWPALRLSDCARTAHGHLDTADASIKKEKEKEKGETEERKKQSIASVLAMITGTIRRRSSLQSVSPSLLHCLLPSVPENVDVHLPACSAKVGGSRSLTVEPARIFMRTWPEFGFHVLSSSASKFGTTLFSSSHFAILVRAVRLPSATEITLSNNRQLLYIGSLFS